MGVDQSKPKRKLEEIDREVRLIRSNLRASNRSYSKEIKNNIQENLVKYSNEASELKGKVKTRQLDSIQKSISQTMKEVITMDSDLDKAAVETDSIVQVPQNIRKTASLERPKNGIKTKNQSKSMPSLMNSPNLQDIENKLKTLKSQIKVALQSEDTTQLRVYQETLKVLATSLEMIEVPEYTPIGDKKNKLEKSITSQYQIINRTLREIKRNRDIKYLTKLKQKEDVTNKLEIIRKELDKYDSLSREAVKTGDTVTVKDLQQNLIHLKHRLNSVESIDEGTKTMKLQMKDKISWLAKVILDSSQKGSQPDLTKAQANYEDIIKNIASGKSKSENDIKVQLESLQDFTSSISSVNEENNKIKKQLLSNITESLTTLNSNRPGSERSTIDIGELGQKSVIERKMSNFKASWNALESTLRKSTISKEAFQPIDSVLGDIQQSITELRSFLKDQHQPILGETVGCAIKGTEMFNGGSKQEESILTSTDDKTVSYLNTGKTRQEETRFSRINEIKTQVYYIKEKFESSIQKPNLKMKLEDYIGTLEEYIKSDNEVIANSARILMTDIYDIIKNIDLSMSKTTDKLPLGYYMDIISRMEENVLKLERTAKSFQADRNDMGYQDTKRLLNEIKEYLETSDIPIEYDKALIKKLQVLKKTEQIIDQCEREYLKREEAYVKEVEKTLEIIRDRIERFNGPFKGVLYNTIEKDLNKILIDADANITDKFVSDEIIKNTEKYLKILENRAIKDQNFQQPKKQEHEKMSTLKEELKEIKNDIDNTPINSINIFIGLNSRLDLLKLSLDQLKNLDENLENQKEIIYNEIETLKNVVEAKIALGQQDINQTSLEEFKKKATEENNRRITEELDKIELTFGKLKEDIKSFIGTKSDKKYYDLDESTMRLIVKMDDLKLAKGTPLYDRKVELLKQIHQYENLLEKRTKETEYISQFERDVADIQLNFITFEKSVKDLDNLTQRLKNLKINLETGKCITPLQGRKNNCIKKMNELEIRIRSKINENILIEENLLQVKYNLELIRKNIQKDDVSLSDLKTKLNSIKTELQDMKNLNSLNFQERAKLLQELEELEKNLTTRENNKSVSVASTELKGVKNKSEKDLHEIEDSVKRLKNEIHIFIGTTKDATFCELDEGINKLIMKLDDMKISEEDSILHDKRVQILRELNECSEILDRRAEATEDIVQFENILHEIEENRSNISENYITDIIENLQKLEVMADLAERKMMCIENLKKLKNKPDPKTTESKLSSCENEFAEFVNRIDSFTETTSDASFVEIENCLQKLTTDLQKLSLRSNSAFDQRKNELLEQIQSCRHAMANKARENKVYGDFMKELDVIKNQINTASNRDVMTKACNKLKFIQADAERGTLKEKLKNDIQKQCTLLLQSYSEKLSSLPITSYIGSEEFIKDLEKSSGSKKVAKPNTNLMSQYEHLAKRLAELEDKVEQFAGNENSIKYKNLEDELLKMNVKVKNLNDLNKSEYMKRKTELKGKTVNCLTILDEKLQDFENIEEVEAELGILEAKLKGNLNENDSDKIDEKLISLQLQLGKLMHLNKSVSEKKNGLLQKIRKLTKTIKQNSSNSNTEDSGTSI